MNGKEIKKRKKKYQIKLAGRFPLMVDRVDRVYSV